MTSVPRGFLSRREVLLRAGLGFGALDLSSLLAPVANAGEPSLWQSPLLSRKPHFAAKAAREHTTLLFESAQDALATQRGRVGAYLLAAHEGKHVWDARGDFINPAKMPQPIGPWQSFAQALLLANETAWVD